MSESHSSVQTTYSARKFPAHYTEIYQTTKSSEGIFARVVVVVVVAAAVAATAASIALYSCSSPNATSVIF
jgi:hypothetical protein